MIDFVTHGDDPPSKPLIKQEKSDKLIILQRIDFLQLNFGLKERFYADASLFSTINQEAAASAEWAHSPSHVHPWLYFPTKEKTERREIIVRCVD